MKKKGSVKEKRVGNEWRKEKVSRGNKKGGNGEGERRKVNEIKVWWTVIRTSEGGRAKKKGEKVNKVYRKPEILKKREAKGKRGRNG